MSETTTDAGTHSRRSFLRAGAAGALGVSASLSGCIGIILGGGYYQQQAQRQQRGAIAGPPISFASQRKRIRKQDATVIVHNRSQLLEAIHRPDAVVWIPEDVTIEMNATGPLAGSNAIAPGVTIASNRNLGDGTGGLIKTDEYIQKLFIAPQSCRVTGLRLKGPRMTYFDPEDVSAYSATGIHFQGQTAIVDNCEAYGWTAMAIGLGTKGTPTQGWIHHNDFHHNQMNHLGYPMELYNGMHLIEWNYFAKYRHAITGYGYPTNGYEARFNVVGPPGGAPAHFAFDMHSLAEQANYPASRTVAGNYVNAHHNVFELTTENALSISGIPRKYARFCNNWCATSKGGDGPGVPAVSAPDAATVRKKHNHFGAPAVTQGRQRLKQLAARLPLSTGNPSLSAWSPPSSTNQSHITESVSPRTPPGRRALREVL